MCVFVFVIVIVIIVILKNFKLCGSKNSKALHKYNDVRIRLFVFFLTLSREPNNTLWFYYFSYSLIDYIYVHYFVIYNSFLGESIFVF